MRKEQPARRHRADDQVSTLGQRPAPPQIDPFGYPGRPTADALNIRGPEVKLPFAASAGLVGDRIEVVHGRGQQMAKSGRQRSLTAARSANNVNPCSHQRAVLSIVWYRDTLTNDCALL